MMQSMLPEALTIGSRYKAMAEEKESKTQAWVSGCVRTRWLLNFKAHLRAEASKNRAQSSKFEQHARLHSFGKHTTKGLQPKSARWRPPSRRHSMEKQRNTMPDCH